MVYRRITFVFRSNVWEYIAKAVRREWYIISHGNETHRLFYDKSHLKNYYFDSNTTYVKNQYLEKIVTTSYGGGTTHRDTLLDWLF